MSYYSIFVTYYDYVSLRFVTAVTVTLAIIFSRRYCRSSGDIYFIRLILIKCLNVGDNKAYITLMYAV